VHGWAIAYCTLTGVLVEVQLAEIRELTGNGHVATFVKVAFGEQGHQATVSGVEGDLHRILVILKVGEETDCQPSAAVLSHLLYVRDATSHDQRVEVGVGFVVRHSCLGKVHEEKTPR